jgi:predicted DsbA family dithiol-disulfide isomerase
MKSVDIQITYDFICPWCWIGHSHLKTALAQLPPDTPVAIQYAPCELNPDMPEDGVDRKTYRSAKFGNWARSQAMDAEAALAGKRAGIDFRYDRVAITPNTRLAHRLMSFAAGKGDAHKTDALFAAVFHAYFSEGRNIGNAEVLVALASQAGFDAQEVRDVMATAAGEREVAAGERQARIDGIRSVPALRIGGSLISGAQPPAVFLQALQQAAAPAAN